MFSHSLATADSCHKKENKKFPFFLSCPVVSVRENVVLSSDMLKVKLELLRAVPRHDIE